MNQNAPKSENCNNYMYVAIFYYLNGVYTGILVEVSIYIIKM